MMKLQALSSFHEVCLRMRLFVGIDDGQCVDLVFVDVDIRFIRQACFNFSLNLNAIQFYRTFR